MSSPLGEPLPGDTNHACSVSLPTWYSVVGYEEGTADICHALKCGYPRFVYHPYVLQLMKMTLEKYSRNTKKGQEDCLILPNAAAARSCHDYLVKALYPNNNISLYSPDNALLDGVTTTKQEEDDSPIRIVDLGTSTQVHAVVFPAQTNASLQAKSYWQHTGEIVSSRRAEQALLELNVAPNYIFPPTQQEEPEEDHATADETDNIMTQFISKLVFDNVSHKDTVTLYPSGMNSIYNALRSARRYQLLRSSDVGNSSSSSSSSKHRRAGRAVVFGFPYLDTLKLCSRSEIVPDGVEFFGHGNDQDLQSLKQFLKSGEKVCAVLTEVPSNPLLQCPNVLELRKLADQYDFALIVDDTIGNFLNVDLIQNGIADAVCTSLTKLFSGRGDVMGGSIVTNPHTSKGRWMQHDLQHFQQLQYDNHASSSDGGRLIYKGDVQALTLNSKDFVQRNAVINRTTEDLVDWLYNHEGISELYYPKFDDNKHIYKDISRGNKSNYGGLFSIMLEPHICPRTFYDTLEIAKGPSLGTNFSLMCPYTLLAHYHELDFAMTYNVQPHSLRISIGLENTNDLKDVFEDAFQRAKLHPKLPISSTTTITQMRGYCTSTNHINKTKNSSITSSIPYTAATTLACGLLKRRANINTLSRYISLLKP